MFFQLGMCGNDKLPFGYTIGNIWLSTDYGWKRLGRGEIVAKGYCYEYDLESPEFVDAIMRKEELTGNFTAIAAMDKSVLVVTNKNRTYPLYAVPETIGNIGLPESAKL